MTEPVLARVLVVDDEAHIGESVKKALERTGYAVECASDSATAWARLEQGPPDLILCDIRLGADDGLGLLARIKESYPEIPVIMITGFASIASAVSAVKAGASDYLPKPFNPDQLRHVVARALDQRRLRDENAYLRGQLSGDGVVVGRNAAMCQLFDTARTVAGADSSVLVTGETGCGKEIVARFIHDNSRRGDRPFVTVNCAAIPPSLIESELFGHRRGAFTGAVYSRRGTFELADGGTLFLDEIAEMPVEMQAKILRVLEERRITRIGSEEAVAVDVRIIAATNKNPAEEIRSGRFREDLYWRLNVVHIAVPPLRDRPEDVLPLARHFLAVYARELKKAVPDFSADVIDTLTRYEWPGNVRELRNAVERAVIFAAPGDVVRLAHLPPYLRPEPSRPAPAAAPSYRPLREMEMQYIREVLAACGGNRTRAAEVLGLSPVTLWRKLGKEPSEEEVISDSGA